MPTWNKMTKADKKAALASKTDDESFAEFASRYSTNKNAVLGFKFRLANPEYEQKRGRTIGREVSNRGLWTEGRLTEKWKPTAKAKAKAPKEPPRVGITWTQSMRDQFTRLYEEGVLYKVIASRLGVSVSACKNMRSYLKLTPRAQGKRGRNKLNGKGTRLHLNMTNDEYDWLRKRSNQTGIPMNDYLRNFIRKDMTNAVQVPELAK